jgi:hypothetical protein
VRAFFIAAWWFFLGAFLMHLLGAYILYPTLRQSGAAEVTRSFFGLAVLALAGLVVAGVAVSVLFLSSRGKRP